MGLGSLIVFTLIYSIGVLFAVTILCLHAVVNDGDKSVTRRWFNIGYACTLFVLSTLGNISNSATAVIAFVNNRDFPGGPNVYLTEHYNTPLSMTGFVAFMLTTLMEDGYLVSRPFRLKKTGQSLVSFITAVSVHSRF
jgi:hypothetical protein